MADAEKSDPVGLRRLLLFGLSLIIMLPALILLALALIVLREFLRFPDKLLALGAVAAVMGALSLVSIGLTAWLARTAWRRTSIRPLP
jgi:hypothetical protein